MNRKAAAFHIAIVDTNTLSAIGLRSILQHVMPVVTVDIFGSLAELEANHPDTFVHFFVGMNIVLEHRKFFEPHQRKTIVLTPTPGQALQFGAFHALCVNQPEQQLVKALLRLEQYAHGGGRNRPPMTAMMEEKVLTDRETEVMALIVQGFINKEIADKLCISLSTVVTHRRNIMEKLRLKSVSALTIYAVTHGYVDINRI